MTKKEESLALADAEARIKEAISIAFNYGNIDGSHHKMWVITQMVRKLLGDEEFKKFLAEYNQDEYEWDEGIAP